MARELREVVFVDGVRTAFGKAGPGGLFWKTRADDMAVKAVRELLRRNPEAPHERIGDVVMAATAQVGDQGLTLGRDVALLAGLPHTVPGFAVDRMCAGALTVDDIGLFELNEPFAVQVLTWCEGMGVDPEDERLNPYGGAIACGHPLAATGVRLMAQLAYGFKERPHVRYGLTALCVGMGMGAALLWENVGAGH